MNMNEDVKVKVSPYDIKALRGKKRNSFTHTSPHRYISVDGHVTCWPLLTTQPI